MVVDVKGGLIELESPVVIGLRLLAVNENTNEEVECSVVDAQCGLSGKTEVMIAFDKLAKSFHEKAGECQVGFSFSSL